MNRAWRAAVKMLSAMVLAGACATVPVTTEHVPPTELPRTLAVLPFVPMPEKDEQTRTLQRMIYGVLSATSYEVIKPQVVEERLVRAGLTDPRVVARQRPEELGKLLRVDGVVFGELTHWDRLFVGVYSQVAAGGTIKIVDTRNGRTVFERSETERGHHVGVPTNALDAVVQVVKAAWNLREIELVRQCDDLVRSLTKGIPSPPVLEARRPPALTTVLSNGAGRVLKAGDVITVGAEGQPGVIGSFDLSPIAKNIPLVETSDGAYVGRYVVKPGDNAVDAFVVARLADRAGRVSEHEDVLGRFTVDTVPPATPTGIALSLRDRSVVLSWTANGETDLAGYRVYRSDAELTGFSALGSTESATYTDAIERIAFYRITAFDRAGNESAPSASVALPVLPSRLSGTVVRDSYLHPVNSPYELAGALTVDSGATLHVLPGVTVKFAPGAAGILVANGAVNARGTGEQRIVFTSASDRARAGDFRNALVIRGAGRTSILEEVLVEHAGTGILIENGGLEAARVALIGNQQAGVDVAETGVLKLSESKVSGHAAGSGITVRGFGRAVLRRNDIVDNGWAVVNYSSNVVEARENWWGAPVPADSLFVGDVDRRDALSTGR
jgi:hypothetical protein